MVEEGLLVVTRAFSEYRKIRISGYDFDMSDIQISEYEGNEYENACFPASDRFCSLPYRPVFLPLLSLAYYSASAARMKG